MDLQSALRQALAAHEQAILAFSQDLIGIASENPPGNCYHECLKRIRLELDRLGIAYRVLGRRATPTGRATICWASTVRGSGRSFSTGITTWCRRRVARNSLLG